MALALATVDKIGLGVVAGVFIVFALASSLLVPRYSETFPGRNGVRLFVLATLVLFVAMMGAVNVFGDEGEAEGGAGHGETAAAKEGGATETGATETGASPKTGAARTIRVAGTEFEFDLPDESLEPGKYTFELKNAGKVIHNLVVEGPGVDNASTPTIESGKTASVDVELASGTYKLYCSVAGHEDAGMKLDLEVS